MQERGAAAGYDLDLGDKAFLGAEVAGDKVLKIIANVLRKGLRGDDLVARSSPC